MVAEGPAEVLHGRRVEREALERLLDAVRGGQSRVLVVSGEPGAGKTALLQSAIGSASGVRGARAVGVEAVAEHHPLRCVVDDAHGLDLASAQAVVFVARRLLAESVALVLVTRDPGDELEGLPRLAVEGLRNGDARALLGSALRVPLDERVRERLVAETRGNPLALLELPRGLTSAQLAGGFGVLDVAGLPGRIEERFRQRDAALPAPARRLLLVAAADPTGDPGLVWRAAAAPPPRAPAAGTAAGRPGAAARA